MKILYLAAIRLPTEKAHGLQIMKTCEALADAGAEVELVVPHRKNHLSDDPFAYYEVRRSFKITQIESIDLVEQGSFGFASSLISFAESAHFLESFWEADIVYGRDALVLAQYLFLGRTLVYEAHTKPTFISKVVARRAARVVVISEGLRTAYEKTGIKKEKIILAPDGIDLAAFSNSESKNAARTRLGLPNNAKIAMYIGKIDTGKGAYVLCEAGQKLRDNEVVALIGGEEKQIEDLKKKYPTVHFLGPRPYRELANNQAAADVLVIPNSKKELDSSTYTSPLKLFSSMASGIPIVAADVPALREVLTDATAYFFIPDDPESLAHAIANAFEQQAIANEKAAKARDMAEKFTWKARAKKILQGLEQLHAC
jgi:glycosyltransferase involved in cell wall biosynthesis